MGSLLATQIVGLVPLCAPAMCWPSCNASRANEVDAFASCRSSECAWPSTRCLAFLRHECADSIHDELGRLHAKACLSPPPPPPPPPPSPAPPPPPPSPESPPPSPPPPRPPDDAWGLTYLHSHAATNDIAVHAMLLSHHREHAMVAFSDLVLECNNKDVPQALLSKYLDLYPHARKRLIRSDTNEGYVCAQLRALAVHFKSRSSPWWRYEWVLMMNPDVFPTLEGLNKLHARLVARPQACLFVFQWPGRYLNTDKTEENTR